MTCGEPQIAGAAVCPNCGAQDRAVAERDLPADRDGRLLECVAAALAAKAALARTRAESRRGAARAHRETVVTLRLMVQRRLVRERVREQPDEDARAALQHALDRLDAELDEA